MAQKTSIEWTEQSWNFLRGCRRVSEGCRNCYAEKIAGRFSGAGLPYHGLATKNSDGARWTGKVSFHEDILLEPLRRKKPTTYFVNSMSDLFYSEVPDEWIDKAFAVMALTPQHTYQILTKRPERMRDYFTNIDILKFWKFVKQLNINEARKELIYRPFDSVGSYSQPLSNVWLGVSVENQKTADERIPLLLETPAAVRWLSVEPLLERVSFGKIPSSAFGRDWNINPLTGVESYDSSHRTGIYKPLDWVVIGGESGTKARFCNIDWIRSIVRDCKGANVPVFVKQLGARSFKATGNGTAETPYKHQYLQLKNKKGGDIFEFPEDLQIREFPKGVATATGV